MYKANFIGYKVIVVVYIRCGNAKPCIYLRDLICYPVK
jgi:hypothetical protein